MSPDFSTAIWFHGLHVQPTGSTRWFFIMLDQTSRTWTVTAGKAAMFSILKSHHHHHPLASYGHLSAQIWSINHTTSENHPKPTTPNSTQKIDHLLPQSKVWNSGKYPQIAIEIGIMTNQRMEWTTHGEMATAPIGSLIANPHEERLPPWPRRPFGHALGLQRGSHADGRGVFDARYQGGHQVVCHLSHKKWMKPGMWWGYNQIFNGYKCALYIYIYIYVHTYYVM